MVADPHALQLRADRRVVGIANHGDGDVLEVSEYRHHFAQNRGARTQFDPAVRFWANIHILHSVATQATLSLLAIDPWIGACISGQNDYYSSGSL